jgi:DNA-binding LacI/PurR family transcriptional regulator
MQEVADRARVSISTVSFVVNDTKPVTPETRRRILEAIDELGYRRNATARALATSKSRNLALLYPLIERNMTVFVESAAMIAESRGYKLVLWPIRGAHPASEVTSLIKTGIADGILLLEVLLDDERVSKLQEVKAPFALIGRTRTLDGTDYVDVNFEQTTRDAIDYLAGMGHANIALVIENFDGTPLAGYSPPVRVEETFRETITDRGLHGSVFRVPRDQKSEFELADLIAEQAPHSTAIIIMHDEAAFGLVNGLRRRGLAIPADISIVSIVTSSALGALFDPPLTTFDAPGSELAGLATEALIDRIESRDVQPMQVLLSCVRHDGGSVERVPVARPGQVARILSSRAEP